MTKSNILYLDDEASNIRTFRTIFKRHYNIFTALSAEEGIRILEKETIQLIITDQRMPKVTGVEFLKSIMHRFPEPIRIILTGYSDLDIIIEAINECDIYRYLTKPWHDEELFHTLEKALETYYLRKENQNLLQKLQETNRGLEEEVQSQSEKLIESEKHYRLLADNATDIIALYDEKGHFLFLSPSTKDVLGYFPDELSSTRLYDLLHPEDLDLIRNEIEPILYQGEPCVCECRLRCKDGSYIWLENSIKPILDESKNLVSFQSSARDISKRKQSEQELITAVKAKEQFLSNMSHEIRTPLNAVVGITNLLVQNNPPAHQAEDLKTLKFSSETLLALINDILDFSKIEEGKIILEKIDFSLRDLIAGLERTFGFLAKDKGISLLSLVEDDVPDVVQGDPVRISQVITNLVNNAIKFTKQGTVKIKLDLLDAGDDWAAIQFVVIDTGIGIPYDKQETIFEFFTQANSDTTRKFGGTGLGLAISKRLLELMGSQIQLRSKEGQGSKFYFTMRLEKGDESQVRDDTGNIQRHYNDFKGKNLKVLLVEDNEMNQLVARKFLQEWGVHPDCAEDGIEAIEKAKNTLYDIILMDLQMPEMDGYEATRHIRKLEDYKHVPIIALTASAMADVKNKVLEVGMNDYVAKPFVPNDLFNKIARYTSQKSQLTSNPESEPANISQEFQPTKENTKVLNYNKILEIAGNNPAFAKELVSGYIKSFKKLNEEFQQAFAAKDAEKIRFIAHRNKSSIQLLGVEPLIEEIRTSVELLENKADNHTLNNTAQKVSTYCATIVVELQAKL